MQHLFTRVRLQACADTPQEDTHRGEAVRVQGVQRTVHAVTPPY